MYYETMLFLYGVLVVLGISALDGVLPQSALRSRMRGTIRTQQ